MTSFFKVHDGIFVLRDTICWLPVDTALANNAVVDPPNDSVLENAVEELPSDDAVFDFVSYCVFCKMFL